VLCLPPYENHIIPENIPLDIVYEDDTLLINKLPGMVVHPGHGIILEPWYMRWPIILYLPMNSSERPG
jgi:23S rRNA pseudouridine1911/1915/1917 synthase